MAHRSKMNEADESTRRTSLLPQRRSNRQASTRMEILTKQVKVEQSDSITAIRSDNPRIVQTTHKRTTSMLPPTGLGRSQQICEPLGTSSLRRPSTNKLPSQGPFRAPARARTSSAGQESQSSAKSSFHGRSVSHQVEHSARPAASTSTSTLNRQSLMRGQKSERALIQQSFTSKKSVISSSRPSSPPSQPASEEDVPSADCFHLQTELAQLHLLHRSAQSTQYQWEKTAEESFRLRFAALGERHAELQEICQEQQALINQLALVQWSDGKSGTQMAEKVALLSRNVADIYSFLENEGKYTRILAVFETWFSQVLQIRKQRKAESGQDTALDFIEGIGDGWKAEAMVLERELTYVSRDLIAFGDVRKDSSLGRIRSLYSKLVLHLIEEIDVIQWIENEISNQEATWINSTIQKLALDDDRDLGSMIFKPAGK